MNKNKDFHLWYHISYLEKLIKRIVRKNSYLKELNLTSTEYFITEYFIIHNEALSFYQLRNLLPMDDRQLHLNIISLIKKGYLQREYIGKSSRIFMDDDAKDKIDKITDLNYIEYIKGSEKEVLDLKNKIETIIGIIEFSGE